jgi:hypothetical protein
MGHFGHHLVAAADLLDEHLRTEDLVAEAADLVAQDLAGVAYQQRRLLHDAAPEVGELP